MTPVTKENIIRGFEAANEKMTDIENALSELLKSNQSTHTQLRSLLAAGFQDMRSTPGQRLLADGGYGQRVRRSCDTGSTSAGRGSEGYG